MRLYSRLSAALLADPDKEHGRRDGSALYLVSGGGFVSAFVQTHRAVH